MSKIGIILKREYMTRVRKTSFIVMTILGPVLFAGLMLAPVIFMKLEGDELKKIKVIDETGLFEDALKNTLYIQFYDVSDEYFLPHHAEYDLSLAKKELKDSDYYGLLFIPRTVVTGGRGVVQLYSYR